MTETDYRAGYVAIIGRPNVGKSTLLNRLLGQKLSITSRKPQTTRHNLLGIKTQNAVQIIYVDTPGLHQQQHNAMNRYLNRAAQSSLVGVDALIWVVEALQWTQEDEAVLRLLEAVEVPILLGVNKVDKVKDKAQLLPFMQSMTDKKACFELFPLSAYHGDNVDALEQALIQLLPKVDSLLFPEDTITDRSERFFAAEIIREKLVRRLGDELPYKLTVQIEAFAVEGNLTRISAVIWVERPGQKAIVIGKQGHQLKEVGKSARHDLEKMLECKVFLQLWVKVKQGWSDDERALRQLGYSE